MPVVLPSANGMTTGLGVAAGWNGAATYPQEQQQPNDPYGSLGSAAGGYPRAIQPIGTAAGIYQSNIANGPMAQQLEMRRRLLESGRGIINLSNPNSPSNAAVWNAQQGVYGANEGVFNATGMQNQANRAVNANEAQNIGMRSGNYERILAASNDVADKSAVAQYNEYLQGRDRRNQMFGAAPEQRIDVSMNQGFGLPSGQVAAPVSNEQKVTREAGIQEKRAGFLSDILQNKAGAAGLDVGDARLNASRVSANASRVKDQAQRADEQTRYEDSLLRNDAEVQKLPPFPGAVMYEDPESGSEWVTAGQKEQRTYERARQLEEERYPAQQQQQQQRAITNAQTTRQLQNAAAGPLGGMSRATIQEMYKQDESLGSDPQGFQQLLQYFLAQGLTQQAAQYEAGKLINDAYEQGVAQRAAREKAKGATTGHKED